MLVSSTPFRTPLFPVRIPVARRCALGSTGRATPSDHTPVAKGFKVGKCKKTWRRRSGRRNRQVEHGSKGKELDYTRLLSRALRAIRYANVRFGILPTQSGFRRDDELSILFKPILGRPSGRHPHPALSRQRERGYQSRPRSYGVHPASTLRPSTLHRRSPITLPESSVTLVPSSITLQASPASLKPARITLQALAASPIPRPITLQASPASLRPSRITHQALPASPLPTPVTHQASPVSIRPSPITHRASSASLAPPPFTL
jgi:hypothetical protein